ncbi:hypothetical protein ACFL3Q_07245 [Planctomycetota bacterium]
MKKWTIIVAILICCCLYALVKFSKPQGQNETNQVENTQIEGQAEAGNTNNAPLAESPGSAVSLTQVEDAGNADKAPLTESSSSAVPPTVVEAVIKDWKKLQSCLKDEDYEQAWGLTSEHFRSRIVKSVEGFKEGSAQMGMATATIHPESATYINGMVALRITGLSVSEDNFYFIFIEEDGQWKLVEGHTP